MSYILRHEAEYRREREREEGSRVYEHNNRQEKLSVRCGDWSLYVQRVFGRRELKLFSLSDEQSRGRG